MSRGYQNLAGRVGSGLEVFEISSNGPGWVRRFSTLTGREGLLDLTRERP